MAFKYIHLLVSSDYIDCVSSERIFTKKKEKKKKKGDKKKKKILFCGIKYAHFHNWNTESLILQIREQNELRN